MELHVKFKRAERERNLFVFFFSQALIPIIGQLTTNVPHSYLQDCCEFKLSAVDDSSFTTLRILPLSPEYVQFAYLVLLVQHFVYVLYASGICLMYFIQLFCHFSGECHGCGLPWHSRSPSRVR